MNTLFISRDFSKFIDGGSIVTQRNFDFLERLGKVDKISIPKAGISTLAHNYLFRQTYGSRPAITAKLKKYLASRHYELIWCDGSLYSGYLELGHLKAKTIAFYHNIEHDFYTAKAKSTGKILDRMMIPYVTHNERISTNLSSARVLLNERDARRLNQIYGRKGNFIMPTTFDSLRIEQIENEIDTSEVPYILFVGSNFFANVEGLDYFFSEIAPYISLPVKIVGSVCEAFDKSELPPNITLEGKVEDLTHYYANSIAIVSPILSGSGTKTKTIEALRYGKTIIGSPEALMGVDSCHYDKIGKMCLTPEDYITCINNLSEERINRESLRIFNDIYSSESLYERFLKFITELQHGNLNEV